MQPVPGGNVPPPHSALELKMTFKDGGAFDFHTSYERVKERLQQIVEVQRETGDMEVGNVHLDDLPRYEEHQQAVSAGAPPVVSAAPQSPTSVQSSPLQETFSPPAGPPPGYEEVQRGSIAEELERRLRST